MNREPFGLYILRLMISMGLFFFICMLYWSSALLEQDMKEIEAQLEKLNSQFSDLKNEMLSNPLVESWQENKVPLKNTIDLKNRKHIDPNLSNLLEEDT